MCPEQVLHVKGVAGLGRLVHTDTGQCLQEYNKVVQESSGVRGGTAFAWCSYHPSEQTVP